MHRYMDTCLEEYVHYSTRMRGVMIKVPRSRKLRHEKSTLSMALLMSRDSKMLRQYVGIRTTRMHQRED